jgi:putative transposase
MKQIKSSRHPVKFANTNKKNQLRIFLNEYRRVAQIYVDYLWNNSLTIKDKTLSRKKKGSKAFKKTQDHRENFINWSINNLNLNDIKQINLENIINIGYKQGRSRFLSHFTNTLIRDKLLDYCNNAGVSVVLQSSTYRSQRCSCCGMVRKSNRKSKMYICKNCGMVMDADLNAAKNHEAVLPNIPFDLRKLSLNRKGFFWKSDGFYDLTGTAFTVPFSK